MEGSDYKQLTALFKSWGVHYEEAYEGDDVVVTVGEDERSGKKVDGYNGFFSDYRFNKATGKFITMGAWE